MPSESSTRRMNHLSCCCGTAVRSRKRGRRRSSKSARRRLENDPAAGRHTSPYTTKRQRRVGEDAAYLSGYRWCVRAAGGLQHRSEHGYTRPSSGIHRLDHLLVNDLVGRFDEEHLVVTTRVDL